MPQEIEHWSLTTLREKPVKIGAKGVRHGRYLTFDLAEVPIPRSLFANIPRPIDGLRPVLYRHDGARSRSIQVAR